jgi:hypothetical protein
MKITIEKREAIEVEVNLPAYRKKGSHLFKIEEKKSTTIYNTECEYQIQVNDYMMRYPFEYDEITESEFNEVYNQVKSKL